MHGVAGKSHGVQCCAPVPHQASGQVRLLGALLGKVAVPRAGPELDKGSQQLLLVPAGLPAKEDCEDGALSSAAARLGQARSDRARLLQTPGRLLKAGGQQQQHAARVAQRGQDTRPGLAGLAHLVVSADDQVGALQALRDVPGEVAFRLPVAYEDVAGLSAAGAPQPSALGGCISLQRRRRALASLVAHQGAGQPAVESQADIERQKLIGGNCHAMHRLLSC